ncbi:HU family DNA-binding protein [Mycoplasma capricolum]|uniref:HU family DNA-binding protein n=1 Tax=Mycoplasma capricolum TaxID=2095 RepID=UPI0022F3CBA0|nr:HU family DNA-binding protein [Mycoplasma capricolum]WBX36498.1 HU family DNA-binding protein [Mycoplasma capricolum subsp. capricolum]
MSKKPSSKYLLVARILLGLFFVAFITIFVLKLVNVYKTYGKIGADFMTVLTGFGVTLAKPVKWGAGLDEFCNIALITWIPLILIVSLIFYILYYKNLVKTIQVKDSTTKLDITIQTEGDVIVETETEEPDKKEEIMDVEPEPMAEYKSVVEEKSMIEPEPMPESEPMIEPEPMPEYKSVVEEKSMVEPEPMAEYKSVVEEKSMIEPEPMPESEPMIEPEPMPEYKSVVEEKSMVEPEPMAEYKSVVEEKSMIEPEPMPESEPMIEPEPMPEPKPVIETKSVMLPTPVEIKKTTEKSKPTKKRKKKKVYPQVTKGMLLEELYEDPEFVEMTKVSIKTIFDKAFIVAGKNLAAGDHVVLAKFGKFETIEKEAQMKMNPSTQEEIEVPAHKVVKFKLSKSIKEKMNK